MINFTLYEKVFLHLDELVQSPDWFEYMDSLEISDYLCDEFLEFETNHSSEIEPIVIEYFNKRLKT